jgi:methylmalonyl-CoA mutase cobalamin-binding subunit
MSLRIALCAGEASGDQLGAGLIEALRARFPDAEFAGIGGDAMRAAGMDTWFDASELAVMGLAEVLRPPAASAEVAQDVPPARAGLAARTSSSASTRPTSTSAWNAGSSNAASAPCIT